MVCQRQEPWLRRLGVVCLTAVFDGNGVAMRCVVLQRVGPGGVRTLFLDPGRWPTFFSGVTGMDGPSGRRQEAPPNSRYVLHGNQYRGACGFTKANKQLNGKVCRAYDGWLKEQLSRVPSAKTASLSGFLHHAAVSLALMRAGKAVYGDLACRRSRCRKAGLQRKQLQRMGQDMGHGESPGISSRWHPDGRPRRQAKPAVSVVGLGDASTGHGGCISGGPSG